MAKQKVSSPKASGAGDKGKKSTGDNNPKKPQNEENKEKATPTKKN